MWQVIFQTRKSVDIVYVTNNCDFQTRNHKRDWFSQNPGICRKDIPSGSRIQIINTNHGRVEVLSFMNESNMIDNQVQLSLLVLKKISEGVIT